MGVEYRVIHKIPRGEEEMKNIPGTETDRIDKGFQRLRFGLENRRETEFAGAKIEGESFERRRSWGPYEVIAENAIAEDGGKVFSVP